jgi:tetratricopeptide (TPR) repeat protein
MEQKSTLADRQRRTVFICLVLALGTALLYWPATSFDFIHFDDPEYVVKNSNLNSGLSWPGLAWCFQAGYAGNWHPLTWMSHMLDCQLFGLKPGGPHAVNLLLHAANSVLVFLVLKRLTNAVWRSAGVAALFALHPLHVESVAWIAERKDVLSALFWLLTIWAYCDYVKKHGIARYFLALVLFIFGLMAKPMVVTLPFVLLLLDWWPLGRFQSKSADSKVAGAAAKFSWPVLLEKLPFLLLAAGSCVLTVIAQRRGRAIASFESLSMLERLANSSVSYLRYVGKIFWPADLSLVYPLVVGWQRWEILGALLFLIVMTALAVVFFRSRPYWMVGWFWFLGTLVPVIGLVQVGAQSMADRYTYIPSIGLFLMITWGTCDLARHWRYHRAALGIAGVAVLALCAFMTERQLGYWKDSPTLYRHVMTIDPNNYLIHTYYGGYLRDVGQLEQARSECEKAVQLAPNYTFGHVLLAGVLLLQGKNPEAISEMRTALKYEPDLVPVRANLADVLLSENLCGEAAAEYGKALEYTPDDPKLHFSLGRSLVMQKKYGEARSEFESALRLPTFSHAVTLSDAELLTARASLGDIYSSENLYDEAAVEYGKALEYKPDAPALHCSLGRALAMQKKFDAAQSEYETALRLNPSYIDAHYELALALSNQHKSAEAIAEYRAALKIHGNFSDALNNLSWILAADPNAQLRNGAEAVQLAEQACALTHNTQAVKVGTLAVAYAEAGRFDDAVNTAQKAHDLAVAQGKADLAARDLELLQLFRARRPYHEAP